MASGAGMFTVDEQERFFRNKQKISAYKQSIRQREIEKDNQKLLKKLVEISSGKGAISTQPIGKSHSMAAIDLQAKSLHFGARRAELERIERENQKIAKKIFCL
jgi:hypothetical protein